ncbi:class C sortase [uncultured Murdochiella sp.]|uniref:class C sortase n=1 Tax=uncultured Murdochiella sp. TaxID=1586095 RepID=UPI00280470C2|nr:class C sortase [uncultured Murdochiella sp.]
MNTERPQQETKEKKDLRLRIAAIFLLLTGVLVLLYPTISNRFNQWRAERLSTVYQVTVKEISDDRFEKEIEKAKEYNQKLAGESVPDVFALRKEHNDPVYDALLNVTGNGMMGEVEIPAIHVKIPIFHYTTDQVLQQNVGHLAGSSLPVGGKGTHTVLSAHRGLPSAKLFTDLNLLKKGDLFFLRVLNQVFAYEVDQMIEVEPTETASLAIDRDKDLCTLFTCTPYGVNSQRLLVRGHRVDYTPEEIEKAFEEERDIRIDKSRLSFHILAAVVGASLGMVPYWIWKKRKKRDEEAARS